MSKPCLSICIATYNRAGFIAETLDSIIPQLTDEVEVVIVDGASTDATQDVVSRYCRRFEKIRYTRLSAKGGVDQDYCKAVDLSEGEYCWLFPDDDLLKPGAVKTVLTAIKKGYSLIVVNAEVFDKTFSRRLQARRLSIAKDEVYLGSELPQLFQRVIDYISFIGCVVINRSLWLKRNKENYVDSEFIHVGVIFQAPLNAPALVLAEPYISIRLGNAQWTQRGYEIWMEKWPKLLLTFNHIPLDMRIAIANPPILKRLEHLVALRATGAYSLKQFHSWFVLNTADVYWRLIAFSLSLIPAFVLNFMLLSLLKLRGKNPLMAIYNLEDNRNNILMRKQ